MNRSIFLDRREMLNCIFRSRRIFGSRKTYCYRIVNPVDRSTIEAASLGHYILRK